TVPPLPGGPPRDRAARSPAAPPAGRGPRRRSPGAPRGRGRAWRTAGRRSPGGPPARGGRRNDSRPGQPPGRHGAPRSLSRAAGVAAIPCRWPPTPLCPRGTPTSRAGTPAPTAWRRPPPPPAGRAVDHRVHPQGDGGADAEAPLKAPDHSGTLDVGQSPLGGDDDLGGERPLQVAGPRQR